MHEYQYSGNKTNGVSVNSKSNAALTKRAVAARARGGGRALFISTVTIDLRLSDYLLYM